MDYCTQPKGHMNWTQDDTMTTDRNGAIRRRRLATNFNEFELDGWTYVNDFQVMN